MILILKSSLWRHYCPSGALLWDDKNTVEIAFALNQKLIMCRVGLPLPFYEIKSRGHHAFLKVITVFFKFYGITLGVCYLSPPPWVNDLRLTQFSRVHYAIDNNLLPM